MALWGTADSLYSVGTVSVDYSTETITGAGTSFTAAGISTGTVIVIGVGGTYGQAVISGITSNTVISIATTQYLSGAPISGVGYTLTQKPVYTLEDQNYSIIPGIGNSSSTNKVYGVDENEIASLEPGASGIATQYGGVHAGWVGIHTYVDMHGNLRVKSETLVAMSEITNGSFATYTATGDADDDSIFADAVSITITSQPASVSVGTTETASFSVTASVIPTYAPLAYQWQFASSGVGAAYTSISGQTNSTLSVSNSDASKNGFKYRVIINSGDVSTTSGIATMTVSWYLKYDI